MQRNEFLKQANELWAQKMVNLNVIMLPLFYICLFKKAFHTNFYYIIYAHFHFRARFMLLCESYGELKEQI